MKLKFVWPAFIAIFFLFIGIKDAKAEVTDVFLTPHNSETKVSFENDKVTYTLIIPENSVISEVTFKIQYDNKPFDFRQLTNLQADYPPDHYIGINSAFKISNLPVIHPCPIFCKSPFEPGTKLILEADFSMAKDQLKDVTYNSLFFGKRFKEALQSFWTDSSSITESFDEKTWIFRVEIIPQVDVEEYAIFEKITPLQNPTNPILVFLGGIGGSVITDAENGVELWPGWKLMFGRDNRHKSLSLGEPIDGVAIATKAQPTDAIRNAGAFGADNMPNWPLLNDDVYGVFLDEILTEKYGYIQYSGKDNPKLLTPAGCDFRQIKSQDKPTLFVAYYDWRKPVPDNAKMLQDFISGCVHYFYPNEQITVIGHSMGGLVAKLALGRMGQGPAYYAKKLITLDTPWLGAPKAVNIALTGDFIPLLIDDDILIKLAKDFPGVFQLFPSQGYFDKGYVFLKKQSEVALLRSESIELRTLVATLNAVFPAQNAKEALKQIELLRSYGLYNFNNGIEYHNIYTLLKYEGTIGQTLASEELVCPTKMLICTIDYGKLETVYSVSGWTKGDDTVSEESLKYPTTLGLSNVKDIPLENTAFWGFGDSSYAHMAMPKNSLVVAKIASVLGLPALLSASVTLTDTENVEDVYYITVRRAESLEIKDSNGITTSVNDKRSLFFTQIPGLTVLGLGGNDYQLIMPKALAYTVTVGITSTTKLLIEKATSEVITPTLTIAYADANTVRSPQIVLNLTSDSNPVLTDNLGIIPPSLITDTLNPTRKLFLPIVQR